MSNDGEGSSYLSRLRNDVAGALAAFRTPVGLFDRDRDTQLPADLAHRVVWVVPEDALADGWQVDTADEEAVTDELDTELDLEHVMLQGYAMARRGDGSTCGGSYLWVVLAEEEQDLREPIAIVDGGHQVAAVHPLAIHEVNPIAWESDPRSPRWGRPSLYQVTANRGGMAFQGVTLHASRLIRIAGMSRTADAAESNNADWSALYVYREAIQGLDQGFRSSARLLERRAIPFVTLKNARAALAGAVADSTTGLGSKLQLLRESLSVDRLGVLTGDDTFAWQSPAVAGTSELIQTLGWRMAAVEGIPIVRLFGVPPAGLSSDDAASERTYNALLNRVRRTCVARALLDLYDIALGRDDTRQVVWPSLNEPTDMEAAQTSLVAAQRDAVLLAEGVITLEESRARHRGGETVKLFVGTEPIEVVDEPMVSAEDMLAIMASAPQGPGDETPEDEA